VPVALSRSAAGWEFSASPASLNADTIALEWTARQEFRDSDRAGLSAVAAVGRNNARLGAECGRRTGLGGLPAMSGTTPFMHSWGNGVKALLSFRMGQSRHTVPLPHSGEIQSGWGTGTVGP